ncbi:hypothetical protein MJO28_011310 [Puccinia striiformis f. sp. tritici]|uniref:Uncharacterized protein n=1 Tax=Puccinia striiformis f. sp. tritici TaxID=168172 RepID=A0ACC0E2C3_9BASI|nr:hypothetical protein Pst134EB_021780 [Puccinia striiformis f. sp. tritici]KAI7943782.1 hypothetical protein MJO28_011310 [Puccinia striiformis f. sp. tritici]KAI9621821.1 hypothetical protein KEM48_007559 [Puccinia striiformis f. sp. tritici PST-130]
MEFYNQAARAIDQVDSKHGSLKSIVFNLATKMKTSSKQAQNGSAAKARQVSDGKRLLRVVAETLRYRQVIESILQAVDVLNSESKIFGKSSSSQSKTAISKQANRSQHPQAQSLILILVHDHLFSSRGISLSKIHKIRLAIERHSSALKAELSRLMVRQGVSQVSDLIDSLKRAGSDSPDEESSPTIVNAPRWMRVNTIKWSLEDAKGWLVDAGWTETSLDVLTKDTSSTTSSDQLLYFAEDNHIANLIALPSKVQLAKLPPYLDGRLIAQDKASCMPAQLLLGDQPTVPPIEVIDATSAPGNKTTMLSSIVGPRGKVWAFEKDHKRFRVLAEMIKLAGCTNVQCINADFLAVNHADERFKNVSHIMVDPSCSGSGISNRLDNLFQNGPKDKRDEERIKSLSRFQTTIVSHALRFPSVNQVVYSTCSIWKEENEEVVLRILNKPEMLSKGWTLKDVTNTFLRNSKTPWTRAGEVITREQKHLSDRMIRFDPTVDQTIGFFAAVFLRASAEPEPVNPKETVVKPFTSIPLEPAPSRSKTVSDQTKKSSVKSPKSLLSSNNIKQGKKKRQIVIRPGKFIFS